MSSVVDSAGVFETQPSSIIIEIIKRCNLACKHCYLSSSAASQEILALPTFARIIDDIAGFWDPSSVTVHLSGGEPLLHESFTDMVVSLGTMGFGIKVLTNATMINDELAALFAQYDVSLQVSVDSHERHTHDAIRGAGSFDMTIAGIQRCQAYPSLMRNMVWRVTLSTVNKNDIADIAAMGAEMGVGSIRFALMEPFGRGNLNSSLVLSSSERRDCYLEIARIAKESDVPRIDGDFFRKLPKKDSDDFCTLGTVLRIDCDSAVFACPLFLHSELAMGTLDTDRLSRIWSQGQVRNLNTIRRLRPHGIPECASCEFIGICQAGCMARAYNHCGTFLAKDPDCECMKLMLAHGPENWD